MSATKQEQVEVLADDPKTSKSLREQLRGLGYAVRASRGRRHARLRTEKPAGVIVVSVPDEPIGQGADLAFGRGGVEKSPTLRTIHELAEDSPDVPILVTVPAGYPAVDAVLESGATDVLVGEVTPGHLRHRLATLRALRDAHPSRPARRTAAHPSSAAPALVGPLPRLRNPGSGRLDAKRMAEFLGVPLRRFARALPYSYGSIHKTSDSNRLQEPLARIARILEDVLALVGTPENVRIWMNRPIPELEGDSPLDTILANETGAVETLVGNVHLGVPG